MRIPPATRTWGVEGCEIVISQSRPVTADELFEHFDWRGMELDNGYLMLKGAGLSKQEKTLELDLCSLADQNLEGYLTGYADYLPIVETEKRERLEVGYTVSSHSRTQSEHDDNLKRWFALGYQEVWDFWPWHRSLYIHTSPFDYQQVKDADFISPYLIMGAKKQWKLPLSQVFEEQE